jgi:uncharacterized protein YbjQ (UPF0145 family)
MTDILVVTTNDVAHARIARVIGAVFGTSIRSRSALGNAFGSMRAAFGGSQSGYTSMMNDTRADAVAALKEQAAACGANAVIAMRFDSGEFDSGRGQSMAEITAYGTAVILEPVE